MASCSECGGSQTILEGSTLSVLRQINRFGKEANLKDSSQRRQNSVDRRRLRRTERMAQGGGTQPDGNIFASPGMVCPSTTRTGLTEALKIAATTAAIPPIIVADMFRRVLLRRLTSLA